MWGFTVSKKAIFAESGVKSYEKGKFVIGLFISPFLCFGAYFYPIFPGIGYHWRAKILQPGEKRFLGHASLQI